MKNQSTIALWSSHLTAIQAAQEVEQNLRWQLSGLTEAVSGAHTAVRVTAATIASQAGISCSRLPESTERNQIMNALRVAINQVPEGERSLSQRDIVRTLERQLSELESREEALQDARATLQDLEESIQEATKHLSEVEGQQPKPTAAGLEMVCEKRDQVQQDLDQIHAKLESTRQSLDALQNAESDTTQADKLEAQLALTGGGKGPSAATIVKANKEVELAQEEARRLESRIRGLIDLESTAAFELAQLDSLRCHIGEAVYMAQLAKSEEGLLKKLVELDVMLQEVNSDRAKLNSVTGEAVSYDLARAKFSMPVLYATAGGSTAAGSSGALQITN